MNIHMNLTVYRRFPLILFFILFLILSSGSTIPEKETAKEFTGFNESYEPAIDSIIKALSLEEKIKMIHGNGMFVSGGVERLGIPELNYTDGPTGIREEMERTSWKPLDLTTDSVTFFPTGTALAATWNEELAYRYGKAIGSEASARGKDILLGPAVNIIRTPLCGRNFEYFTEDPMLNSRLAVGYIEGVQSQNVAACIKHYAMNNQEFERGIVNVLVDERTMREIYLPAFKAAAQEAEVYTFMGSYNKVAGDWMCENNTLLNKVLKDEWGYKGAVMSDWGGTHSAVKAANAGLDIEMGGYLEKHHFASLIDSVRTGLLPESTIDDKVRRILRVMYNCKTMESTRIRGEANSTENTQLAYDVASEAIVLLKNSEKLLPLNLTALKSIAVIGENAVHPQARGGFGASVKARYEVSPLEGLKKKVGDRITINYAQGFKENFIIIDKGGRWPYRFPDTISSPSLIEEAVKAAKNSDVTIIFAGTSRNVETEAVDRETLKFPFGQDELIEAVSAANPKTVVVVVAGAACDLNVTDQSASTILYSWFNGSEAGNAIADVLFGDVNPSGKLPFTIPVRLKDIGAHALNAYPGHNQVVEYKEGILVGYRWFDTKWVEPKYPFGYGLSYTDFIYENLKTDKSRYSPGEIIVLTLTVQNTGSTAGKETVEVYVHAQASSVPRAAKELKAFKKVLIEKGQSQKIQLKVNVDDLSFYDAKEKKWTVEPGKYDFLVGSSSRDIRLESSVIIE